jgi:hypothetical protein
MVHTAIVLPSDMLDRLKKDAEAKGVGLSAEIRFRLVVTELMHVSPKDLETNTLLHAIRRLSNYLAQDLGKRWHEHAYAMAAFKAGVAALLARYQPLGDENVRPDAQAVGDPPDALGRTHARRIAIAGHETEDDYEPTNEYDPTDDYDETELEVRKKREPAMSRKKLED